jgi:hypothetical protein
LKYIIANFAAAISAMICLRHDRVRVEIDGVCAPFACRRSGGLIFRRLVCGDRQELHAKLRRGVLDRVARRLRVVPNGEARQTRHQFLYQLDALASDVEDGVRHSREITTWMGKTLCEPQCHRVNDKTEDKSGSLW